MKWTNTYSLPLPLCEAIEAHEHNIGDADISVTQLIQPPQAIELTRQHYDEIVKDYSDNLWPLFGSIAHAIVASHSQVGTETEGEKTLEIEYDGWKISGTPDLVTNGTELTDWKLTSMYAVKDGVKLEWEQQLNLYALLLAKTGVVVTNLQIIAMLRDWSAHITLTVNKERKQAKEIFPCPIVVLPVPMWEAETVSTYLHDRIRLHKSARQERIWSPCTEEETWNGKRCERYCSAAAFCTQYQEHK